MQSLILPNRNDVIILFPDTALPLKSSIVISNQPLPQSIPSISSIKNYAEMLWHLPSP